MDLKDRKFINNNKITLPKFEIGTENIPTNSIYSSQRMGQYNVDDDLFTGGEGTNLPEFVVRRNNKFQIPTISNLFGPSKLEMPELKIKGSLIDAGAGGVKHNTPHSTSGILEQQDNSVDKKSKLSGIAGNAANILTGAMGLWSLGNQISEGSKARINPEEMLMKYGTSNTNIGNGFSYERQNNIDTTSEMDQVKAETNQATMGMAMTGMSTGAAVGSLLGPVGGAVGGAIGGIAGAIGGLFGGASRRRKEAERLRRANILANATTNENRQRAFTEKIQKEVANKYGNQEDQLLYASKGAEYVMPNGLTNKNHNTQTAFGNVNAPANALTKANEKIVHEENGKYYIHKVTGNKSDSNYTYLFPNDSVITEENAPYVEQAIREGRYNEFLQKQALDREMKHGKISTNKNNNLVRARKGLEWYMNAIPAITGFGIGMQQYNKAANQDIYKPNSFQQNQYIGALNDLDKLHIDYLPIANEQRAAEARANRAIDYSGGLSTGQRATNRVALNLNTQNAIANGLMNWQKWNNELRAAAAKSRLEVGAQEAQRKQQAMQWDADVYAKGHAAREQQMNMGLYNMQNALEQYAANEFDRNMGIAYLNLYEQENQRKWAELWNKMGGNNTTQKTSSGNITTPYTTSPIQIPYQAPEAKTKLDWNDIMPKPFESTFKLPAGDNKNNPYIFQQPSTEVVTKRISPTENMWGINYTKPTKTANKKYSSKVKNNGRITSANVSKQVNNNYQIPSEPVIMRPGQNAIESVRSIVERNRNEVLGNLSNTDAKQIKSKSRNNPKTNAEALKNLGQYLMLGRKEYNKRFGL